MKKIALIIIAIVAALNIIGGGYWVYKTTTGGQPRLKTHEYFPETEVSRNALDLSGKGLTNIPSTVFSQTNLEELNVSNNRLTGAIQAEVRHLSNLRILNASNNLMTGVPAEIGQLQKLEILDLSNNKLTGLPYELGNLKNLKTLNLLGNQYSQQDLDYIKNKLPSTVNIITN